MPKLLLSSVAGPHGAGNVNYNISTDRLTRGQDIFTLVSHNHYDQLHFLATNVNSPATVLEHPTLDDLASELQQGYEVVGINFTLADISRTLEMCARIKSESPGTRVVLGGHGTTCFSTVFSKMSIMQRNVDELCQGEGVRFLRRLLGEDPHGPYRQPLGPLFGATVPWLDPFPRGTMGTILSGLGCPNRCEFCSTSHYYGGEFIDLFGAPEIHRGIRDLVRVHPRVRQVNISDENLFRDREKVLALGRLIREDERMGLDRMAFFGFGSVHGLSSYDVEELVRAGVGGIWIGVESKFSTLAKSRGRDPQELFDELHAHGITTIGSWIGGWDYHTPQNILEDLDQYVSLRPTQSQLLPMIPMPGTPSWDHYAGRSARGEAFLFGAAGENGRRPFSEEELWRVIDRGHRTLYERAGPSLVRYLQVALNGLEYCSAHARRELREDKAAYHRHTAGGLYHILLAADVFAPNDLVRGQVRGVREQFHRLMGPPGPGKLVMERYALLKAIRARIDLAFGAGIIREEPFRLYRYRQGGTEEGGRPFAVTYPREDRHFEYQTRKANAEHAYIRKLIDRVEAPGTHPDEIQRIIEDVLGDLDRAAGVATRISAADWANREDLESGVTVLREGQKALKNVQRHGPVDLPGLRVSLTC